MRSYLPQLTKTGTSTNWYMHAGQQLAYNIHKHECIPIAMELLRSHHRNVFNIEKNKLDYNNY